MRKNVINKMRGGLDHAPRRAGRTDATPFAGVGNDKIVAAIGTAGAGKTVGENAAFEVATEFTFGKCRGASAISVVVLRQPGGQMRLHHAVKQRAFRLAPVVNRRHATRFGNCVRHEHPNRGIGRMTVCPYSSQIHPVARLLDGFLTSVLFDQIPSSIRAGSSRTSLIVTRLSTASRPSIMR